jgi:hypothetical protein
MSGWLIYLIPLSVVLVLFIGYKILKKRIQKKVDQQKEIVDQHKVTVSIFVLEKKMGKISDARIPKNLLDQIPRLYKLKKMPLITAKVGPQIVTLICEEKIFEKIPDKKNVTVDLAGIFIADVKNVQHTQHKKKRK